MPLASAPAWSSDGGLVQLSTLQHPPVDILLVITELAAKQIGLEAGSINVDTPIEQLGIDSLGFLEFLFELEDHVGCPIPQKDVASVKTLRELASVIDALMVAAKSSTSA